ncbi:MAG: TolC family protein [Kofleriaceae bacterium]
MKFTPLLLLAVPSLALAQPAPAPAPAPPATPAPLPPDQPQNPPAADSPQWLPGVVDVTAAETAVPGKLTLTMARAVEIAEKTQPALHQARATIEAASGRVEGAKVAEHPVVNLSASVSAGSDPRGPCVLADPNSGLCGGFFSGSYGTALGASANWKIYDFGLTHANVVAAEANEDAARAGYSVSSLDVRRDVEIAYLEALARKRLVLVAQATVKSEQAHLDQAKRFVAAQAKDPIEVAQAQSRASNALSTLAQSQSDEAVALANLRAAIGWIDPTRAPAVDPNWPTPIDQDPADLGSLVATARKLRPEITQLDKQIYAADAGVTAAHAERRPVLSASASAQWMPGESNWSPQPSWSAGLALSWALWDGGRSGADVKVANANLISAQAQRDALLVSLTSALESSRAQIIANKANVVASTEGISAAQAELKLAEARYAQGLGSQIELADAQTAVTTASGNLISAEWNLAAAWATLRRALGQQTAP